MKHLPRLAVLSLLCFPVFATTYPDEINYPHFERLYQQESQTLEALTRQMNSLSTEVDSIEKNLNYLNTTYRNNSNELLNINNTLRNLSNESRQLGAQRDRLIREERDYSARASRAQNDYDRRRRDVEMEARRLNPLRDQVQRAEREVQSVRNNHSNEVRQLNSAQFEYRTAQNELNRVKSELMRLSSTPNRTPQQESQLSSLRQRQFSLESEVSRKASAITNHQNRAQQLTMELSRKENEARQARAQFDREAQRLSVLEQQLAQVQREVNQLNDSLRLTKNNLTNTERRLSSISIEMNNLQTRMSNIEQNQYRLSQDISNAQRRLQSVTSNLRSVENEVRSQTARAQSAYDQYLSRYNLYTHHFQEAQKLGQGQVVTAAPKGSEQGEKDAKARGEALGKTMGQMVSGAQGNLWGAMRAEVEGYHKGYEEGYQSPKTEAQKEARKDALVSAKNYVESVIRPVYFEEEIQKEIVKPQNRINKRLTLSRELESQMFQGSLELSAEEREASLNLMTEYDSIIAGFIKDETQALTRAEVTSRPISSYAPQTKYPLDQVNCSQVYKGVSDFKKACEDHFRTHYASVFEDHAWETYQEKFTDIFNNSFQATFNQQIGQHYQAAFDRAYAVTHAFGVERGKADMYKEAYQAQFDLSYPEFVEDQKLRVKSEVPAELQNYLSSNALLTVSGVKFDEELIAGEEITLKGVLRNLGQAKSGVSIFKIISAQLAEVVTNNISSPEVGPLKVIEVAGPRMRLSSQALTGQMVKVVVEATLPGDKYKSVRTETVTFEKKIAANPSQTISLNVDQTPAIRSVLRRFLIHTLSADLSPRFENLKDNLDAQIRVIEGSEHIDLKNSQESVAAMNMGVKRNVKFSYVFKDSAKNREIKLELVLLRKGRVIQTEQIILKPH